MFDLFRSREKSQRYLLGGLLGLVALSLVVTLPGVGMNSQDGGRQNLVAEVGGEPITAQDIQTGVRGALQNASLPPDMVDIFVPQFVNQAITEQALAFEAKRLGFMVTDQDVASMIKTFPVFFPNGQFVGQLQYEAFLNQNGMTVQRFEENLRKQLLLLKLRNFIAEGSVVTPQEVEREYRRLNEQVRFEFVSLTQAGLRSQVVVSPQEVETAFKASAAQYTIPEKKSYRLLVIDQAKLADTVQVSDAELQQAYASAGDRFRTPERVKVRHILVKTTDQPKEVVPTLRKKADDLLKQLRGGADFAELAKKNSDDTGSAVKGGDLGLLVRGQTVPNFDKAAFTLPVNQISDVVETEFGFHILQVQEKQEARLRPFDEVKAELAEERKRQSVADRMQTVAQQAQAALAKTPNQPEQVAQQFGLPAPVTVANAGPGDPIPEVGTSQALDQALAGLKAGQVTAPISVNPTKSVIAVVTDVQPTRPAQLAEVETQVREQLVATKSRELVTARARQLAEKAKQTGDLAAAAKELGLEVKTSAPTTRIGTIEGLGTASYVLDAFNQPVGTVVGPVGAGEQTAVVRVAEKLPVDMTKFAAEREKTLTSLKGQKARERNELFEDGLVQRLSNEGKIKRYDENIRRLQQSMRG